MVNSTPTCVGPPSSTQSMRPSRSPITCPACVGETRPERLAEGAATGTPAAAQQRLRDRMRGHAQRHAVEPRAGEIADRAAGRSRARPASAGRARRLQRARAASASNAPSRSAAARSGTCEISGLNCGRSFAAYIFATVSPGSRRRRARRPSRSERRRARRRATCAPASAMAAGFGFQETGDERRH